LRLLLDEHHHPLVASRLRELGHDVSAVAERDDLRGRPDDEIFAVAIAEGRVVVTEDHRDFAILVKVAIELDRHHPGVIFTTASRHPRIPSARDALVRALMSLLEQHRSPDALRDSVIWLEP
jgi:predicted nuclease of predicted toxin-antitoxin system